MLEILRRIEAGQEELKAGQDELKAQGRNTAARISNSHRRDPLMPLVREVRAAPGAPAALGSLPPAGIFPATLESLYHLTVAQLRTISTFYSVRFVPATGNIASIDLSAGRQELAAYIGIL